MTDSAPDTQFDENTSAAPAPRKSNNFYFFLGMAIGAAPPLLLSIYSFQQFEDYSASLPPDAVRCGTPIIVPMALIVFVTPITALIGGGISLLLVVIFRTKGQNQTSEIKP